MAKLRLNWRYGVMMAVFSASLLLTVSESDSAAAFFVGKAVGLAGFALLGVLVRRWGSRGKIGGLLRLAGEE